MPSLAVFGDATSSLISEARTVTVKIGSSLLVDAATSKLREHWLEGLAQDVARMRDRGQRVLLVSSGAIALGRKILGYDSGALSLEQSQAAAAVGQIRLAQAYTTALAPYEILAAQVLFTLGDTQNRRRYLNARATLKTLLATHCVPIINENDTVATDEIRYGDNDRLAASAALMVGSDALIMLSDVDGLYTADPQTEPNARRISKVAEITQSMLETAGGTGSADAKGGMHTKLLAAQIAMQGGCLTAVSRGDVRAPVRALEEGMPCTWFYPSANPRAARKQWIAGMKTGGTLVVDAGAARALRAGNSLLPVGLRAVEKTFSRGDPVEIRDEKGRSLGSGLAAYSAEEARKIAGLSTVAIRDALGYPGRAALVHRDDMVLW